MKLKNPLSVFRADTRYVKKISGSVDIASTDNEDVDVVNLSDGKRARWELYIVDGVSKAYSCSIIGHAEGASASYTRFADLGDDINLTVSLTSDGTSMALNLTNNEAISITVAYARCSV